MRESLPRIRAAGAEVALVGQGTPEMAADARRETAWEGTILVDAEGAAYGAAGMGKTSLLGLLRPRLFAEARKARRQGHRQTRVAGNAWRLGGVVVVAPGGRILFARADEHVEDDLPVDEVLRCLRPGPG